MGELLDRNYQLQILQKMADDYPASSDINETFGPRENNSLKVNLAYLNEFGLIECKSYPTFDDSSPLPISGKISASGLDFLADDGGLSAILDVVTIRFDDATLRSLLLKRIENEDEDDGVKAQMAKAVKSMPAKALNAIGDKAINYGIASAPAVLLLLKEQLGM